MIHGTVRINIDTSTCATDNDIQVLSADKRKLGKIISKGVRKLVGEKGMDVTQNRQDIEHQVKLNLVLEPKLS